MYRKMISFAPLLLLVLAAGAFAALPTGWTSRDIGTTGGSADVSGGIWTVKADGTDIWGTADQLHFAYTTLTGNGEVIARVTSVGTGTNNWAKGGVMMRVDLNANSANACVMVTPSSGGGLTFQIRPTTGAASTSQHTQAPNVTPPHWVRLVREGNKFSAYRSTDGIAWTQQGTTQTITMPATIYIGIAVTSHASGEVRTYTLDNVKVEPMKRASEPAPADGALVPATWISLGWVAGATAASHDVYFGEDQAAVQTGSGRTFCRNQTDAWFMVGLGMPGDPAPAGLVIGKTYYWRVDEVEADGVTKHLGRVWSFFVPPKTAYNPTPADATYLVAADTDLSWAAGHQAKLHTIYFGQDYATVANATSGGVSLVATTYDPGPLANDTTYYWRVDEFDGAVTHKGAAWSFTTTPPGLGSIVMQRWENISGTALSALRNDPRFPDTPNVTENLTQFLWDVVDLNTYGARIYGWLYAPATGDYTFRLATDDNGELRLSTNDDPDNARLIASVSGYSGVNEFSKYAQQTSAAVSLVGGQKYYIEALWKEGSGGDHCHVQWQGPSIGSYATIAGKYLSPFEPVKAYGPRPANGATNVTRDVQLTWKSGKFAASHDIYLGTDATAVANATKASPLYKGNQPKAAEEYDPGILQLEQTYYWRVDEVNTSHPEGPWIGSVWSFTVGNFLVIDDMEDYNNFPPDRIFETWIDGWGNQSVNGAIVGHPDPDFDAGEDFAETGIFHGGLQSMPYYYNCNFKYSEATMTPTGSNRDWTAEGVKSLSVWFRGYPAMQGSLTEGPVGTYTLTGAGADIWGTADQFHYAYKMLNGPGTITAKVGAIANLQPGVALNEWAKGGVMIRETLDPNSAYALMLLTGTNTQGIAFQNRPSAAASAVSTQQKNTIHNRPLWLKLDRAFDGTFTASHANDVAGAPDKWTTMTTANIQMAANVYVGLALTSHQAYAQARATFSNITIEGTVTGAWTSQDIGIRSNQAEPMFVAIKGTTGSPSIVYYSDPQIPQPTLRNTWTEWNIPLTAFAGVNLSNVDSISIGFGTKGNTSPGGSGLMYFDDIRLYRGRCFPLLVRPDGDFNRNCTVDMPDLDLLANNWLRQSYKVTPANPDTAGGLIARYPLDGSATDVVGGRNGTVNGTPAWVAGKIGQAIDVKIVGDYVGVDANATRLGIGGGAAKTVTAWAYTRSFNNGGIFDMGAGSNGQNFCLRTLTTPNAWRAQRWGSAYDFDFEYPSLNTWVHFAHVYDGAGQSWVYADGQLVGTKAAILNTADTRPFEIGRYNTNYYFDGMIDEVRIYNRGLSQAEAAYLAGKTTTFDQQLPLMLTPQDPKMDANGDRTINFKDYASLIDSWLEEKLWP